MIIPIYKPWITELEKKYSKEAIESEWISSQGAYIRRFEEAFACFIGCKHAIAVNNGTSACHLALLSCGIKEGDEVIIPACTFIATANAVKYCGAKPVLADIDRETWNVSLENIKKARTRKTKAVFLVHLLGNPCDKEIYEWCEKEGIICIEDACESIGASYGKTRTGNMGLVSAFSFFGNKNLTTGEGGMVTTNNDVVAEKCRLLKGQGQGDKRYFHTDVGYNYRMTNVQAAIGLAQVERIQEILSEKRRIFQHYSRELANIAIMQKIKEGTEHACWMFGIVSKYRTEIEEELRKEGVDTRPMFYPINDMPPYFSEEIFPCSRTLSKYGLMLPSFPELKEEEINKICSIIKHVAG